MTRFSKGDRVYIKDSPPGLPGYHPRERLATVAGESTGSNGTRVAPVTYLVNVLPMHGDVAEAVQPVTEDQLEPAGSLGEQYEQVLGPFSDFITMWTEGVKLSRRPPEPRDIDLIGINWPEWFLIAEIRNSGVEVPIVRDHPEWRWHMAVLAR